MFGSTRQYIVSLQLKRYQPYTKSVKTLKKFIKGLYFDPSDDIGINQCLSDVINHGSSSIQLRVKEKEAKKIQKMSEKGEISRVNLRQVM